MDGVLPGRSSPQPVGSPVPVSKLFDEHANCRVQPGLYRVVQGTDVTAAPELDSDLVAELEPGALVTISEVALSPMDSRVRGRVAQPASGWISLASTDAAAPHLWARPASAGASRQQNTLSGQAVSQMRPASAYSGLAIGWRASAAVHAAGSDEGTNNRPASAPPVHNWRMDGSNLAQNAERFPRIEGIEEKAMAPTSIRPAPDAACHTRFSDQLFEGRWTNSRQPGEDTIISVAGAVCTGMDGQRCAFSILGTDRCVLDLHGENHYGELDASSSSIVWDDGDVWLRDYPPCLALEGSTAHGRPESPSPLPASRSSPDHAPPGSTAHGRPESPVPLLASRSSPDSTSYGRPESPSPLLASSRNEISSNSVSAASPHGHRPAAFEKHALAAEFEEIALRLEAMRELQVRHHQELKGLFSGQETTPMSASRALGVPIFSGRPRAAPADVGRIAEEPEVTSQDPFRLNAEATSVQPRTQNGGWQASASEKQKSPQDSDASEIEGGISEWTLLGLPPSSREISEHQSMTPTPRIGQKAKGSILKFIDEKTKPQERSKSPHYGRCASRSSGSGTLAGEGVVRTLVRRSEFANFWAVAILTHVAIVILMVNEHVQGEGRHYFAMDVDGNVFQWLHLADHVFSGLFLVELGLRMVGERWSFFRGPMWRWNVSDLLLVTVPGVCLLVFNDLGAFAGVRMIRLVRVLVVDSRQFGVWGSRMAVMIVNSLGTMIWSIMILGFVMLGFCVVFVEGTARVLRDSGDTLDDEALGKLLRFFGSMPRALLSLWMAISGGKDWSDFLEPLLLLGEAHVTLFIFYIMFGILVVLNVVQGAFLDGAVQVAQADRDDRLRQQLADSEDYAKHLQDLFHEADEDGSGLLGWEEFRDHCRSSHVKAYLATLKLNLSDVWGLFRLLDVNGNGFVSIEEFVSGCVRLKGEAKSIDLCTLLYESRKTAMKIVSIEKHTRQRFARLDEAAGLPAWKAPRKSMARLRTTVSGNLRREVGSPSNLQTEGSLNQLPNIVSSGSLMTEPRPA